MKGRYSQYLGQTPQSQPLPERTNMTRNRAGGWVFETDDMTRLRRFLVLGSEHGSYYATARELTREAATCIDRLLESGAGMAVLDEIVEVSDSARAPSNEPAILALALCLKTADNLLVRRAAAWNVTRVCRTASHLASLVTAIEALGVPHGKEPRRGTGGGWGPLSRAAVNSWIEGKSVDDLAYQAIKYRKRQDWTLAQIIRLSHPQAPSNQHAALYDWILRREASERSPRREAARDWVPAIIEAFERAQIENDPQRLAYRIEEDRLPWEAIPDRWNSDLTVQRALFQQMPITATLRQLGRMTSIGLLTPGAKETDLVIQRLTNPQVLSGGRIHPMAIYLALKTYQAGHGYRTSWTPVPAIADALEAAFFLAFKAKAPSRKRMVIGVDCSGSMWNGRVTGGAQGLVANEAAAVMAYLQSFGNPNAQVIAFSTYAKAVEFKEEGSLAAIESAPAEWEVRGGTDCSQPIMWALENQQGVEGFTIWTDEETWAGRNHPVEALALYRQRNNIKSKLAIGSLVAHGYQLTEPGPEDAGMLQVIGLDTAAPSLIDSFMAEPME